MSYDCQYCDKSFEEEENREIHKSKHFHGTENIARGGKKSDSIVSEWKRAAEGETAK